MMLLRINVSALKGKNAHFPNCREKQVNGDSATTTKLKLRYNVAIHSTGPFFFRFFCARFLFFSHPPLHYCFVLFFFSRAPITLLMVPPLVLSS